MSAFLLMDPPYAGGYRAEAPPKHADLRTLSRRMPSVLAFLALAWFGALVAFTVTGFTPTPALEWSVIEVAGCFVASVADLVVLALLFRGRSTGLRDFASCAVPAVLPVCVLTFAALVFVNRR